MPGGPLARETWAGPLLRVGGSGEGGPSIATRPPRLCSWPDAAKLVAAHLTHP